MSNSAHLALRDAAVAAMLASMALAGVPVAPNRRRPMAQNVDRQINVSLGESKVLESPIGMSNWATRLHVECTARQDITDSAETRADALFTAAFGVLMASGSFAAGMSCRAVAALWAEDETDATVTAVHGVFEVWHRTTFDAIAA